MTDNGAGLAQGAATSVPLAASPLVAGVAGRYFGDCQEAVRPRSLRRVLENRTHGANP